MREKLIIFILSLLFLFLCSWIYNVFRYLENFNKNEFSLGNACQISKKYVKNGKNISILFLCVSIIVVLVSAWNLYKKK